MESSDFTLTLHRPSDPAPGAERFLAMARSVTVEHADDLTIAADDLASIKQQKDALEKQRKSLLGPVNEMRDRVNALFNPAIEFLGQAETVIKGAISRFQISEQQRIERERRQAEEASRAEQARLRKEAEEQQQRAQEAAQKGDERAAEEAQQQAEELTTAASTMPTVVAQIEPAPKVRGISIRENWSAEVADLPALVAAVAAGKVPIQALQADTKFLNQQAKAMKAALAYPGVRAINTPVVASSKRVAA